jgi:dihydroflavonol-4-reductase
LAGRALVTGSEGHIGKHVVAGLRAAGWSIAAIDLALGQDVRTHALPTDVDAVFHLAQIHWTGRESPAELEDVAMRGLDAVAEVARRSGCRLVWTGSCAAVGDTSDEPLDESAWNAHPVTPYQAAKVAAERRLWDAHADVDAVSVLPAMCIGPGGSTPSTRRVDGMLKRPRQPFWIRGGLNVVDVRDVAAGHLAALERGRRGERYILGGHNLTVRQLMEACRETRGIRASPWVRMPDRAMLTLARLPGIPVTPAQLSRRLERMLWVSSAKAQQQLGYTIRPLATTLHDHWAQRVT